MIPDGLVVMYSNVVNDVFGGENIRALEQRVHFLAPPLTAEALANRADLLSRVEIIFSSWGSPVMDEAFLQKAPRLRAIFYAAGTIRGWATDAVWKRGITVSTAASANAIPVAEYTASIIYFSLKQGWRYALGTKRLGRCPERVAAAGTFRSTVGIVSLGTIARLVIERLKSSAFEILAFDPYADPVQAARLGVELVSLEDVFSRCDVVSLHTPLLPETHGLIGREHFSAMKPGATFINTSRGEIVREADLIETFSQRTDLTAVLDVTSPEPPVENSPLYTLPNIVLTPHIAGSSGNECRRMGEAMIAEFDRWIVGAPLKCQVTQAQAALMA